MARGQAISVDNTVDPLLAPGAMVLEHAGLGLLHTKQSFLRVGDLVYS